jgi:hypothetical protein
LLLALLGMAASALRGHPGIDDILDRIKEAIAPSGEYAALSRRLVADWLNTTKNLADPIRLNFESQWEYLPAPLTTMERKNAKVKFDNFKSEKEDFSLEDETHPSNYFSRNWRVERIRIVNCKAISDLTFQIKDSSGIAPWLMLLGDNGTGKSTVLRSVALALIGEKYFDRLKTEMELDLAGFVRDGCEFAEITVYISGTTKPRKMRIYKSGIVWSSADAAPRYSSSDTVPPVCCRAKPRPARLVNTMLELRACSTQPCRWSIHDRG